MKVYFKKDDGKLGMILVSGENIDHRDAILEVQEALVASGEGYNKPVLALIQGGKA